MKKSIQTGKARLFAGMRVGAVLTALALAFTVGFSACPMDSGGGGGGGGLDKTALEASIAAAEAAKDGVREATSAGEVPLGTKWVTAAEMTDFTGAITTAKTARDSATSQAAINSAKTTLDTAKDTFNSKKKDGSAAPLNTSELAAKIAEAEAARDGVKQSSTNGSDVAQGARWVTASVWNTFDTAINTAKTALTATVQSTVDNAVSPLNTAITTFNDAKQNGSKTAGFSAAELTALITQANAAKAGVTPSANGNDVSPTEYWASQSDISALTTAITNAGSANDANRDSLYLALAGALTTFTGTAKKTGTVPDKTALNSAITSANTAKQGVVEAASAAQAPLGSKWATAAQFAPFNTAYDTALAAATSANATKNAVDAAASGLVSATTAFTGAVNGNGPGEKANSLTITGLPVADFANGSSINLGLFESGDITMDAQPPVYGQAEVSNGQAVVQLYSASTSSAWAGGGSWYAGILLQDGRAFISKAAIDFTANAAPTQAFSGFKPYVYSVTLGDTGFFDEGTQSVTLDQFFTAITGASYAEWLTEAGAAYKLYKNEAMTQEFSGTDTVSANTVVYSVYPIGAEANGGFEPPEFTPLIVNTWANGNIATEGGEQWFKFTATADTQYLYFAPGTLPYVSVEVYDSTGTKVAGNDRFLTAGFHPSISVSNGQVYYIKAAPSGGSFGEYRLTFNTGDTLPPIQVPAEYTTLTEDRWADGNLPEGGEQWFKFTATADTQYIHFAPGTLSDLYVEVYDSTGTAVGNQTRLSSYSSTERTVSNGQLYYIRVLPYNSSQSGEYQIAFSSNSTPLPIQLPTEYTTLNADTWVNGNLPQNGQQWFKFTATVSGSQYIHFAGGSSLSSVYVEVYDSTGTEVGSRTELYGYTSRTVTSGQVYYIKVTPSSSFHGGNYEIGFNTSTTAPLPAGFATAVELTANTWANDTLPQNGVQWFKFTATVTDQQYIHFTPGTLTSVYVQVYNSTGTAVGSRSNLWSGTRYTSSSVTSGQVYYIKVWPSSSFDSGTYEITFNTSTTAPLPAGFATAVELTANTWEAGNITEGGQQWFKFTATAATQYLHFTPGTLTEVYVQVYDSTNTAVGSQSYLYSGTRYTSSSVTSGQVYYIKASPSSSSYSGTYEITFNESYTPPLPAAAASATTLNANAWTAGTLPQNGVQWYKFTATVTDQQYIHFTPGTLTYVYVQVYASTGATIGSETYLYSGTRYTSSSVTSGEEYYIKVWPYSSSYSGTYEITFNESDTAPLPAAAASATTLNANAWTAGTLPQNGVQWFKFTATVTGDQYIHFTPGTLTYVYVQVYASTGAVVAFQTYLRDDTRFTNISATTGEEYYFYIKATEYSTPSSGDYEIAFNESSTAPLPAAAASATQLTANTWAAGNITEGGQQWFKFTATVTGDQYIHFTPGTLTYVYVQVYASTGAVVGSQSNLSSGARYTSSSATTGEEYYFYIKATEYSTPSSGDYEIAFNESSTPPADG